MTHTEHTPASQTFTRRRPSGPPDPPGTDADREAARPRDAARDEAPSRDSRSPGSGARPRRDPVRGKRRLPAAGARGRSLRARIEPMAVRPLRDGRYVVETEGGTYVVDVEAGDCTCPDHAIRDVRCKHLRRVAIEVTEGLVPPPGARRVTCATCGRGTFAPTTAPGPHLCERHDRAPGDVVRDRETGAALVVLGRRPGRADRVRTDEGRRVADYPSNANYGGHEPVFDCVYLASVALVTDRVAVGDARQYSFPASRLAPRRDGRTVRVEFVPESAGPAAESTSAARRRTDARSRPGSRAASQSTLVDG